MQEIEQDEFLGFFHSCTFFCIALWITALSHLYDVSIVAFIIEQKQ